MRQRRVRLPLSPAQELLARRLAQRTPIEAQLENPWWAAVAVVLAPHPDSLLLIRRAERSGDPWSGHIGLPGGRRDPSDSDLCDTAMRETEEEVGVPLGRHHLLGTLDDVWPRSPATRTVVVRPYVFAVPERPAVVLSDEVADTFWVSLSDLQDPSLYRDTTVSLLGQPRSFPAYHLQGHVVWGLTERVLRPIVELIG